MIDPRAIVDPTAELGADVSIGPWTQIGPGVTIGDGTEIASHVIVKGPTVIGARNKIFQFSTVGEDTPALAYGGEPTVLEIGDDNVIREGVTIHRGMVQDDGKTMIGNHCLLMAYVHVGHDCVVGNHVIMSNNASLSGHVHVGDYANFGGYSGVAQFRSIGAQSHIAAMSLIIKDVPDYMTVAGNPAGAVGLNLEGMKRRNVAKDSMRALRSAYKLLYQSNLTAREAVEQMRQLGDDVFVAQFADSVESSRWGVVRPRGARE